MKKILNIIWKDVLLRFSSASELIFFIVLPVLFTLFLGGGLGGNEAAESDTRIPVLIVDEDAGELSALLVVALDSSTAVRGLVSNRDEAEQQFEAGEAPALLIIATGFGAALEKADSAPLFLRQQPNNNNAMIARQAIVTAAAAVTDPLAIAEASTAEAERRRPFAAEAERKVYFQESLSLARGLYREAPSRIVISQPSQATTDAAADFSQSAQAAHAAAGQLVTWVFIPMLAASALFVDERARGTFQRLLTTPTRKGTFLLSTALGQVGLALFQMVLLIGFGILVMGVNWGHSLGALALMLVAFSLASVGFGIMMGTFIKTVEQASGLSIMFGMSMAMLGGAWYPIEIFPDAAQRAVQILPTTWAMRGLSDIVIRGQGLAEVLPEVGVLLAFAAVFFALGTWRFQFE